MMFDWLALLLCSSGNMANPHKHSHQGMIFSSAHCHTEFDTRSGHTFPCLPECCLNVHLTFETTHKYPLEDDTHMQLY